MIINKVRLVPVSMRERERERVRERDMERESEREREVFDIVFFCHPIFLA